MKKIIFLILVIGLGKAHAQNDSLKENLTNIPGTKLFLKLPEGFKVSQNNYGFENNKGVFVSVLESPIGNFYESTFKKEFFESKGGRVMFYDEHKIGDYQAKMIQVRFFEKDLFLYGFGDSTFFLSLSGMTLHQDSLTFKKIISCLETIVYDTSMTIDYLEVAKFKLNTSESSYKFIGHSINIYIYTNDSIVKEKEKIDNKVLVCTFPYDKNTMSPKIIGQMMLMKSIEKGLFYDEFEFESTESVNGYKAHEFYFVGTMKGEKVQGYYLILVNGEMAIFFNGLAKNNFAENLKEFQHLGRQLKFK